MTRKPTYSELVARVKELEKEISRLNGRHAAVQKSESRLKEAEHLAQLGHWELDLIRNTLYWSDESLP